MWIHAESGTIFILHSEIRAFFSNVSFPSVMSDDDLLSVGVFPVIIGAAPEYDALTHKCVQKQPKLIGGEWVAEFSIVPLSAEEVKLAQTAAIAAVEAAIDAHLDSVAQSYRFEDRTRLALRAAYPNPWQALGIAFGTWMDTCNAMVAAGLQDVLNGTLELPTASETIAQLPVFVAP